MTVVSHSINASWNARVETPDALAGRFSLLLKRLKRLHPAFDDWQWLAVDDFVSFTRVEHDLASAAAQNVVRGDWGEPLPIDGFNLVVVNSPHENKPIGLSIGITGGSAIRSSSSNNAHIQTSTFVDPDPSIVRYDVWKSALLALAESFGVDWCAAYPRDLTRLWPAEKRYCRAWMSYLCPFFASMVTPPPTAIVEYRPNGALFLAATDETFVTSNPAHLAVARDIETALAPLNAMTIL